MTLLRLKNYRETPPNFYHWTCPDTGTKITSWDVESWLGKAIKHLQANNLPVPINLLAQMEDQMCQTLPPGWCDYDDPDRPRAELGLSWNDVETASLTFLEWFKEGRPTVEQEEAERRANICTNCYLNVRAGGCGRSCRELIRTMFGLFLDKTTRVDQSLNNCAACKCILRLKVHFPLALIEEHDKDEFQMLLPSFCWLKRSGPNYK